MMETQEVLTGTQEVLHGCILTKQVPPARPKKNMSVEPCRTLKLTLKHWNFKVRCWLMMASPAGPKGSKPKKIFFEGQMIRFPCGTQSCR